MADSTNDGHSKSNSKDTVIGALALVLLAIIAGACAWYGTAQAKSDVFAEFHVRQHRPRIIFEPESFKPQVPFDDFLQTQLRLIKSPFVLAAALRNPEIAKLPFSANEEYPVQALELALKTERVAKEFMRVIWIGPETKDAAAIINAVAAAYLEEVVNSEQAKMGEKKTNLERIYRDIEDRLNKKQTALRRLKESLNTADSATLTVKQQMAVEYFSELRREFVRTRFELTKARIQLQVLLMQSKNDPAGDTAGPVDDEATQEQDGTEVADPVADGETSDLAALRQSMETVVEVLLDSRKSTPRESERELERRVELLAAEEQQYRIELESQKLEARKIGVASFELESLENEVARMKKVGDALATEISMLAVELQTDSRVSLHRLAEPLRSDP